jgi:hypothetical protein
MNLHQRADLRLKVEARLQSLQQRRLLLSWTHAGLRVEFVGSTAYSANSEASGLIQLAGLLSALYDETVGALFIDEPEVSLHPQWQQFLLHEIISVAGDPRENPGKKLIVYCSHSEAMVKLRQLADFANFVFFQDSKSLPVQLPPTKGPLLSNALQRLVDRAAARLRPSLFAKTILIVEGPSDEIIAEALSSRLGISLSSASVEVIPALGKTEIVDTTRLFSLIGKRVVTLADLDALADDNSLVSLYSPLPSCIAAASAKGFESTTKMDGSIRNDFAAAVAKEWHVIESQCAAHPYISGLTGSIDDQTRRRAALSWLLCAAPDSLRDNWRNLRNRFDALLDVLSVGGCFFVRQGTIESCYTNAVHAPDKIAAASAEAATFITANESLLRRAYADLVSALAAAAPPSLVDEGRMLRAKLAGLVAAAFQELTPDTTQEQMDIITQNAFPEAAELFHLVNVTPKKDNATRAVEVRLKSSLFNTPNLPATIKVTDTLTTRIEELIP